MAETESEANVAPVNGTSIYLFTCLLVYLFTCLLVYLFTRLLVYLVYLVYSVYLLTYKYGTL